MKTRKKWYIWTSFWKDSSKQLHFIYGYAVQTNQDDLPQDLKEAEHKLDNRDVIVYQQIITNSSYNKIFQENKISLKSNIIPIFFENKVIQNRLGHFSNTTILSTIKGSEDLYQRFESSDAFISNILKFLEKQTSITFTDINNYERLGCFECIFNHPWLDNSAPYQLNILKNNKPAIEGVEIRRTTEFAKSSHLVHLVLKHKGNTVLERIYAIPKYECIYTLFDGGTLDFTQIKYWLFSENGKSLIHYSSDNLLTTMNTNISIITGTKKIQDKLARKATGKNKELGEKASQVTTSSIASNSTLSSSNQNWLETKYFINNKVKRFFAHPKNDLWLSKGIENEVLTIEKIRELISKRNCKKAILADPFFGYDALHRFALRIEGNDTDLTIITSLGKENPDSKTDTSNPEQKLSNALLNLKGLIIPNLKLINLRDTKNNNQAFHDRYLCLYDNEDSGIQVYLLSNSLNKVSGNWPFCMSILAPDVAYKVMKYLEGLCLGQDIECDSEIEITYQWPK